HQYWWEVRYPEAGVVTANEIHVPVGRPVRIALESRDVIHSFWAPSLAGKLDLVPGRVNELWLQADTPGEYRGQCAEFCGTQHAKMAFLLIARPPREFAAWLERQRLPAAVPRQP
ncbi:MAG: cytochrome c oxidase subunit II, partial [Gammaproteobacteria bacterium]|nr:cytochrome c oxidase subunit II [Gemmatimonadota bacterium]NIU76442.1 cytochrome c oxidase subunit II [Gammaproteobacteria bacterium]NIY10231.1 cytochrome c oxidase subunit II [Gemmatimonadota bacterium]